MDWKSLTTRGTDPIVRFTWPPLMIRVAIRATADELLKEYKACESPDYISYVRPPISFSAHCNMHGQGSNDGEQAG